MIKKRAIEKPFLRPIRHEMGQKIGQFVLDVSISVSSHIWRQSTLIKASFVRAFAFFGNCLKSFIKIGHGVTGGRDKKY